jgi:hypothetical protein
MRGKRGRRRDSDEGEAGCRRVRRWAKANLSMKGGLAAVLTKAVSIS